MDTISRKDLLAPYTEFEERNNIKETRHDIPYKFLGVSPSKYYKFIDMNTKELANTVSKLFNKLYRKYL